MRVLANDGPLKMLGSAGILNYELSTSSSMAITFENLVNFSFAKINKQTGKNNQSIVFLIHTIA
jgi:hypothetical protein